MPRSSNGVGTVHYGRSAEMEDGSYITTVWFVFLFLPVVPIRSERILPLSLSEWDLNTDFRYASLKRVPLDWPQIVRTYLVSLGILGWYALGIFLWGRLSAFFGEDNMYFLAMGWLVLPFSILFVWQKWIRTPPRLKLVRPTFDAQHGVYRKDKERG